MGAPRAEIDHLPALRRRHHPRGLGGENGLQLDLIEHQRLDPLRLDDGRAHFEERFVGKDRRALGHGPDAAGKAQIAQHRQKTGIEPAGLFKEGDVVLAETQLLSGP